jgi:hypothetical protein
MDIDVSLKVATRLQAMCNNARIQHTIDIKNTICIKLWFTSRKDNLLASDHLARVKVVVHIFRWEHAMEGA